MASIFIPPYNAGFVFQVQILPSRQDAKNVKHIIMQVGILAALREVIIKAEIVRSGQNGMRNFRGEQFSGQD
jgi:hypothetical protein